MKLRLLSTMIATALVLTAVLLSGSWSSHPAAADEPSLPIVFVHGAAGSAAQYETQAMRFASNGYPNFVTGIDRTSSTPSTLNPMLDAFFDQVMADTGAEQIYVVAHSLGTSLMVNYLNSSPERTARVARYINIDGTTGATCPGNPAPVECLGVWGQGNPARAMGPNNVYFPDHGHTQTVTSAQSFVEQYKFLTGKEPKTTLVLPEPPGEVDVAGRAINFPANTGVVGTLEVWEVDDATGHRKYAEPLAAFDLGEAADGAWGPVQINGKKHYEFVLVRTDGELVGHYYRQPFLRDDHLVRLLAAPPGSPTLLNTASGPDHAAAVLIRYKEWWSDQGAGSDIMYVSTNSPTWANDPANPPPPALNIFSDTAVAPRAANKIGVHIHDAGVDKDSTLAPIPFFAGLIFQTGVDIWMPATDPPDGTITFVSAQRGDTTRLQVVNVPNWASSDHRISIQFNDYVQDINSWAECVMVRPSPCLGQ